MEDLDELMYFVEVYVEESFYGGVGWYLYCLEFLDGGVGWSGFGYCGIFCWSMCFEILVYVYG